MLFSSHYISVHTIDMTNHSPGSSSGQEFTCQCRRQKRCKFHPWVGKIPWRREWQPTPVFLPREFHGRRSLVGCSPWGRKDSDTTERLTLVTGPLLLARRWWWVVMNCPLKQEVKIVTLRFPMSQMHSWQWTRTLVGRA